MSAAEVVKKFHEAGKAKDKVGISQHGLDGMGGGVDSSMLTLQDGSRGGVSANILARPDVVNTGTTSRLKAQRKSQGQPEGQSGGAEGLVDAGVVR